MKRGYLALLLLLFLALAVGVTNAAPRAAAVSNYDLAWWTTDGGGATASAGGAYLLGGTAGQPDAGTLQGSPYILAGGFWEGGATLQNSVYLPLICKSSARR